MFRLIFIIGFIFINFMAFAVNCTDPYEGYDCDDVEYFTGTVILDEYPDCEIPIDYKKTVCTDGNDRKVFFEIIGYRILNTTECQAFVEDNQLPDGSPNWDFMIWFSYAAFEKLATDDFLAYYNIASPLIKASMECPNTLTTYSFVRSHCTSITTHLLIAGPGDPPGYFEWVINYHPCTEDICCERTIELCYNTSIDEVEIVEDVISHTTGECGEPNIPQNYIYDWLSPCYEDCYIPQY